MAAKATEAVCYLQVSGQGQVESGRVDRQRSAVRSRAMAERLAIVEEFRDEGVSGTKPISERPGLSSLLDRILGNGVRTVLVEKADRLARDLVEGELILREFCRLGVRVIEAEGGTDLTAGGDDNPTAKLIRQVLGAVVEFEKSALVSKLRAARRRKRRTGSRVEGRKPYSGEVVDLVRKLRRRRKRGVAWSYQMIADELSRRGVPTKNGKPWNQGTVAHLLGGRPGCPAMHSQVHCRARCVHHALESSGREGPSQPSGQVAFGSWLSTNGPNGDWFFRSVLWIANALRGTLTTRSLSVRQRRKVTSPRNSREQPRLVWVPSPEDREEFIKLVVDDDTIKRLLNPPPWLHKLGEYAGLVHGDVLNFENPGATVAYALFRGLKRPMRSQQLDSLTYAYVTNPPRSFTYEKRYDPPVGILKPSGSVFVTYADIPNDENVLARMISNEEAEQGVVGKVKWWEWTMASHPPNSDATDPLPVNYSTRYRHRSW